MLWTGLWTKHEDILQSREERFSKQKGLSYVSMCELLWPSGGNLPHDSPRQGTTWTHTHTHTDSEVHLSVTCCLYRQMHSFLYEDEPLWCLQWHHDYLLRTHTHTHTLPLLAFPRYLVIAKQSKVSLCVWTSRCSGAVQHAIAGSTDEGEITNMHIKLPRQREYSFTISPSSQRPSIRKCASVHVQWTERVVVHNLNVMNLSQACLVFDWLQLFPPLQQILHS